MMSSLPGTHIPGYQDQASVARLSYRQLGATDMRVSSLSFGASSLGGVFRDTEDEQSGQCREWPGDRHLLRINFSLTVGHF